MPSRRTTSLIIRVLTATLLVAGVLTVGDPIAAVSHRPSTSPAGATLDGSDCPPGFGELLCTQDPGGGDTGEGPIQVFFSQVLVTARVGDTWDTGAVSNLQIPNYGDAFIPTITVTGPCHTNSSRLGDINITATAVGLCTFTAVASTDNPPKTSTARWTTTVVKGPQTISWNDWPGSIAVNHDVSINVTASSGLPVTLTGSGACTTAGSFVRAGASPGVCTVTATQAGNDAYLPAASSFKTIQIYVPTQINQYLSWGNFPSHYLVGDQFTLTATSDSGSGIPIVFGATGACTISGALVTAAATPGTCTVTVSQAGNSAYLAAASLTLNLTIAPKISQQLIWNPGPGAQAIYSTIQPAQTALHFSVYSLAALAVSVSATGPCTLTASPPHTVNGFPVTDGVLTPTSVGSCVVTASNTGSATVAGATSTRTVKFRGDIAPLSLTTTLPDHVTVGDSIAVEAVSTSGLPITVLDAGNDDCTFTQTGSSVDADGTSHTTARLDADNAGNCTVWFRVDATGSTTWLSGQEITPSLTVDPTQASIAVAPVTATYGDPLPGLANVASSSGFPDGDAQLASLTCTAPDVAVDGNGAVQSPAGTYDLACTVADNPNRIVTITTSTLTVVPAPLAIALETPTAGEPGTIVLNGTVTPPDGNGGDVSAAQVQVTVWDGTDNTGAVAADSVAASVAADGTFTASVALPAGTYFAQASVVPDDKWIGDDAATDGTEATAGFALVTPPPPTTVADPPRSTTTTTISGDPTSTSTTGPTVTVAGSGTSAGGTVGGASANGQSGAGSNLPFTGANSSGLAAFGGMVLVLGLSLTALRGRRERRPRRG